MEEAREGDNLLYKLQKRRDTLLGTDVAALPGFWCSSHRIDLVSALPEKKIRFVQELLQFFRSVVGHVMFSHRAQGLLDFIATAFFFDHGENVHAKSRSLASVSRAPTRWLSDTKPLQEFLARSDDMYLYAFELASETLKAHADMGKSWKGRMQDIRFWIVLPGILDMLLIMNSFNESTQPGSTSLESAAKQLQLCSDRLEDNTLRTRSVANGQKPSLAVALVMAFHEDAHAKKVPQNVTHLAKVLSTFSVEVRKEKKTGVESRLAVRKITYTVMDASGAAQPREKEIVTEITAQTVKESVSVLYAYGHCLMRDLARRFCGTYVVTDLQIIWKVDLDLTLADSAIPCAVLTRVAKFFHVELSIFETAVTELHKLKTTMLEDICAAEGKDTSKASTLTLHVVWSQVVPAAEADPLLLEQTQPAHRSLKLLLMVKPTNAMVEGDAATKRRLKVQMGGEANPLLVDQRMAIVTEGPAANTPDLSSHPLIVEAAREFMGRKNRQVTASKVKAGPDGLSDEHKAKIASSLKSPVKASNHEDPVGTNLVDGVTESSSVDDEEYDVLSAAGLASPDALWSMIDDVDETFIKDSTGRAGGLAVVQKPAPKKKKGGKARAKRSSAPSSASSSAAPMPVVSEAGVEDYTSDAEEDAAKDGKSEPANNHDAATASDAVIDSADESSE